MFPTYRLETQMPSHFNSNTYYEKTASEIHPGKPLVGAEETKVCIIGGGFSGLSTALHLSELGQENILLEANSLGSGASGRNGGQLVTGYPVDLAALKSQLTQREIQNLWDMAIEAQRYIRSLIERWQIRCDLRDGYLFAALTQRQLRSLETMAQGWRRQGYRKIHTLNKAEMQYRTGSPRYVGGLFDAGGGQLHPLNLLHGMADAAEGLGARIFSSSPVVAVEQADGANWLIRTNVGEVRCKEVVVCCNAYGRGLFPVVEQRVLPMYSFVGVTHPLSEAQRRTILPTGNAVSDWRTIADYYRMTPDGRLLFGGGASLKSWPQARIVRYLRSGIRHIFPQLNAIEIDMAWQGALAMTTLQLPQIARINIGGEKYGLWTAQGYSGQGIALSVLAGQLIAQAISDRSDRYRIFQNLSHDAWRTGRIAQRLAALGIFWQRLQDRF